MLVVGIVACALSLAWALPPVVVSGATGRVGSAVVRSLVARRGSTDQIYVLARDVAKAENMLPAGVICLAAPYEDPDALAGAFSSVPDSFRLFIACNNSPQQAELESNVARAAQKNGCAFIVKLSTASPVLEKKDGGPHAAHLTVEDLLGELGLPHAVLRPNIFMDELATGSLLGVASALSESDECTHPFADAAISAVDVRDVGECAAALLAADEVTTNDDCPTLYEITGPAVRKFGIELASAISELRPRPVVISPISVEEFVAPLSLPVEAAKSVASFLGVLQRDCSHATDVVHALTGRPPRTLHQFVHDHPAAFVPSSFERLVGSPAGSYRAAARTVTIDTRSELAKLAIDEVFVKTIVAGVNGGADTFDVTRAAPDAENIRLGHEGVGVIVAAGVETNLDAGDRVAFIGGGYSEYTTVKARMCTRVDLRADAAEQTALRISGLTAAVSLRRTAPVRKGDVVVVTACCGATGSFAVQVAKAAGATVIGTVGSESKVAVARQLGVDRVVNWREESLAQVLVSEYPAGVDLAYEGVGGPLLGAICEHLKPGGRVLVVGSISQYPHNEERAGHGIAGVGEIMDEVFRPGKTIELPSGEGRVLIGNVWGDAFSSGVLPEMREQLYSDHASGAITALVDTTRTFSGVGAAVDAVEHMLSGRSVGKVVLRIGYDAGLPA